MNCPKCKNIEMELIEVEQVEFDFCNNGCLGLWCEKGELAFYVTSANDLPFNHELKHAKSTELNCPHCENEKLVEVKYDNDNDLWLDFCHTCHGIFLDQGELGKVQKSVSRIPFKFRYNLAIKQLKDMGYTIK
ncbi:zf-TFIIB domain-containing protein [Bacteriovoracaceae bacterium]|nr:zf-TFIIB domain-containing protein [Bacteriovoracaceae bacterium]